MKETILMYANGNREISTGHLRRSLTIAMALEELSLAPVFIVSDTESEIWLTDYMRSEEHSYPILRTEGNYNHPDEEIDEMRKMVTEQNASFLLMDSYFAGDDFFTAWKEKGGCAIGFIDDFGTERSRDMWEALDLVVNYDISEPFVTEAGKQVPLYRHVKNKLTGCAYAPLRKAFRNTSFSVWEEASRLMITTGGGDPYGVSAGIVRECLRRPELQDMELHVIAGPAYSTDVISQLDQMRAKSENLIIHRRVRDMALEMQSCDMFISAAGTTLYELCAVGVPGISFIMEDNQIAGAVQFEEENLIPCAGDLRADRDGVIGALVRELAVLKDDPGARKERSLKMRKAIDGQGADRIALKIKEIAGGAS